MNRISLLLILMVAFCSLTYGQSPQKFKFQAVARDAANNPYTSANLAIRISLVRDGVSGLIDYSERHEVTTSPLGVFDLEIGGGNPISGQFSDANWAMHPYYLKVDIDPNGGTTYVNLGTSQLLSVPYAIYAGSAGNGGGGGDPTDELQNLIYDPATQTLTLTDGNTVTLTFPGGSDSQSLSFNSTTNELSISNGNTVIIPAGNGEVGPQGPQGEQGPQGTPGMNGATGPQGPQGTSGMDGETGPQGPAGAGVQIVGSVANAAALNPAYGGDIGDMFISQNDGHGHVWNGSSWDDVGQIQGPAGPQGAPGMDGVAGPQGPMGNAGSQGPQGVAGNDGAAGPQGSQGPAGPTGSQGPQGPAGAGVQIVGSVANAAALDPAYSGAIGDMFISQNDGHGHVWNGSSWDDVGQIQGPAGPQGAPGMDGVAGPQGPMGNAGSQGPQGVAGNDGTTGPQGEQGPAGSTGPQGIPGMNGAAGAQGPQGEQGPAGPTGSQGPQGPAGAGVQIIGSVANAAALDPAYMGAAGDMFISQDDGHGHVWNGSSWDDVGQIQGPAGAQGVPGMDGAAGAQGPQGNPGVDGATGPQGPQGEQGPAGAQGIAGMDGAAGAQGPQGNPGTDGATGPQGSQGEQGPAGAQGVPGMDGATGAQGPQGNPGMNGATGSQGPQGIPGMDGATGSQGPQGIPGMDGATGPQGPQGPAGTYTAGAGIAINGDQISATDISATNEIQSLSLNGSNLQISGGNTVNLGGLGGSSPWSTTGSDIYYNTGDVGIGNTAPAAPLHVTGGDLLTPVARLQGGNPWLGYYNTGGTLKGNLWYDVPSSHMVVTNNDASGQIRFNINFDYKMTINSNGDVGIGTTTPGNKLHVVGDLRVDDGTPSVQFYDENDWHGYIFNDGTDMVMGNVHNGSILLQTNSINRGEFDSDGLTVNGAGGSIELKNTFTTGPLISADGGSQDLRIATTGVAVSASGGVNSGDYMMRIVEPGSYGLNLYNGNTENDWELFADGSGDLQLWADNSFRGSFDGTSGAYTSVSDSKLKSNVHELGNILDGVLALNASRYTYLDNNPEQKESIGFLAQEVQEVFPELVQNNTGERLEGGILSVDYSGFGVLAIKAIQEQQTTIEELQANLNEKSDELEQQQQLIETLEARLTRLEALLDK